MKITKSKLKQLIKEELAGTEIKVPEVKLVAVVPDAEGHPSEEAGVSQFEVDGKTIYVGSGMDEFGGLNGPGHGMAGIASAIAVDIAEARGLSRDKKNKLGVAILKQIAPQYREAISDGAFDEDLLDAMENDTLKDYYNKTTQGDRSPWSLVLKPERVDDDVLQRLKNKANPDQAKDKNRDVFSDLYNESLNKQMKITKSKLKQIIKEELAEMQRTDIDPDTLSDEDVLGTEEPDDIANYDKFQMYFADDDMVRALKKMDARKLAKVIADVVDDKEAFLKFLDLYSKTEDPFYN